MKKLTQKTYFIALKDLTTRALDDKVNPLEIGATLQSVLKCYQIAFTEGLANALMEPPAKAKKKK